MANSGDGLLGSSALRAISADFQSSDYDMKATIPLDLSFQTIKQITLELSNLAAAQTRHMDVVPLWTPLIVVLLALHMHQVEFVDQSMAFEQTQRAVHRYTIDLRVDATGTA